ncbi:MAG TPA: PHB depolymerase family esterase [Caulobacteraceae bacterium]
MKLFAAVFACMALAAPAWGDGADGLQENVTFAAVTPLASNAEMARRLLTPFQNALVAQRLAASGAALADQPLSVAQQRFTLYVPATPPPGGYGLLVFIPPWEDAHLPDGWAGVLEKAGVIFVSAVGSGNADSVLGRREPLALLAAANVTQRYKIDPAQVWIGGFSGGSRIALRLALAYPDVFKGAILNAGSDPVGEGEVAVPPADLFARFQASSRLVYLTGDEDSVRQGMDAASQDSLRSWCVFRTRTIETPGEGHDVASGAALAKALAALDTTPAVDPAKLAACQANLGKQLGAQLDQAQARIGAGDRDAAQKLLTQIDRRWGGLAAPRSLDLLRQATVAK